MLRLFSLIFLFATIPSLSQQPQAPKETEDVRLPSGKLQKEAILKADYEKSMEDAAALVKAAEDLKMDMEKNGEHVFSVATLKQLDNIDKLAKRIRTRLKRY